MSSHDIIVIAASAGGVGALQPLVAGLPAELNASLFIVMHLPSSVHSHLPASLFYEIFLPKQAKALIDCQKIHSPDMSPTLA